jgi:hypothetical protein
VSIIHASEGGWLRTRCARSGVRLRTTEASVRLRGSARLTAVKAGGNARAV